MTAYQPFSLKRDSFKSIEIKDDRVEFFMDAEGLDLLAVLVRFAREALAEFEAKGAPA